MKAKAITAAVLAAILAGAAAAASAEGCTGLGRARGAEALAPAATHTDTYVVYPEASPEIYSAPAYIAYPEASHVVFADGEVLRFDDPATALALTDQARAACADAPARVAALR